MSEVKLEEISNNMEKYNNYKTQMGRLKKALNSQFYLEAMFIEYAIIEDRAEAILRYENNSIKEKEGHPVSINRKLKRILALTEERNSLAGKYIDTKVVNEILEWKEERNGLIHALMKKKITTEEICVIVFKGEELAKSFTNMATNYRRALERKNKKNSK